MRRVKVRSIVEGHSGTFLLHLIQFLKCPLLMQSGSASHPQMAMKRCKRRLDLGEEDEFGELDNAIAIVPI